MKNLLVKLSGLAMSAAIILSLGSVSEASSYTVVKNDSLWKIAKEKLGDGRRYGEIFEANKNQIKNPSMIQIGQVLEIPDAVSSATVEKPDAVSSATVEKPDAVSGATVEKPEETPAPAPEVKEEESAPTFQQAVSENLPGAINEFKTLKADEKKTVELEYSKTTMYKTKDGVLVADSDTKSETDINKRVVTFLYEHDDAYQLVVYLTRKEGSKTILVFDVSADGKESKLIYASTDNNETADTDVNVADLVAGGEGTIKIKATKDEATGITNKVSEIVAGGKVRRTTYIQVKADDKSKTVDAASFNEDKTEITNLTFETTYDGDKQTEVVTITDTDGTGTLSFESDKDGVVASSAKYSAQKNFRDVNIRKNADLVSTLNYVKVGKETSLNYSGSEQFLKKISDDVVYSETKPETGNVISDILFKNGNGYLKLENVDLVNDEGSIIAFFAVQEDGSSVPLYLSTTDDTVGEKTTKLDSVGSENFELKTKTVENKDKSRSKTIQVIVDGKVLITSEVEISADGNKVDTVSKLGERETKLGFVVDGKTVTTTIKGSEGDCILSYDRTEDGKILYDTIKMEMK